MQKLTFKSIDKILDKRTRRRLRWLAAARVASNALDLAGLTGVAVLAASFGSIASGAGGSIELPVAGRLILGEFHAVLLSIGVLLVFLSKSIFSIWLNFRTSMTIAQFEIELAGDLAKDYFSPARLEVAGSEKSVSEFQNRSIFATRSISSFVNARLTFLAEASLLLSMLVIFLAVNPLATFAMFIGMALLLFVLNQVLGIRIKRNGELVVAGNKQALQASRDLFGVRREAVSSGSLENWLDDFTIGKRMAAEGTALTYSINSLPRYVVETALIAGVIAFIGAVVVFSDLATESVTIGIFLAGGLRVIGSLLPLQSAYNSMQSGAAQSDLAFEDLVRIRTCSTHDPTSAAVVQSSVGLSFKDVSFSYNGADVPTLKNVTFEVQPLSKVAIVGPSGAGKSTLFDLAAGFLEPDEGSVMLGGVPARAALLSNPGMIGLVAQRPHLVSGTISKNVSLLGDGTTSLEKVRDCLVRAGLAKYTEHPRWFDFDVQPDSGQYSGGEIQRIGLARALYRDPKILFLDEATSALDAETEAEISLVLDSLRRNMTIVLIAHRLSTVIDADKIVYINGGKVVSEGSFSYLKSKVPEFAKAVSLMSLDQK